MVRRWMAVTVLTMAVLIPAMAQPPAGRPGGPFGGRLGGPMLMVGLLRSPQVQQELKLTDQQKQQLEQLGEQWREKMRGLRDLPPEERRQKVQGMRAEVEKQLSQILNEQQMKRLKQIALQVEGYAALERPEIADQVGLTKEQRQKIRDILRQADEKRREAFQQGQGDRQAAFQRMREIRQWVDGEIEKLLTAEQKKKWQELVGAPFKFEGGFGGFGGARQRAQRQRART
jgi:Spy/CpxP family protein refolding chaperone